VLWRVSAAFIVVDHRLNTANQNEVLNTPLDAPYGLEESFHGLPDFRKHAPLSALAEHSSNPSEVVGNRA
jgi:hypothetical protein